MLPLSLKPISSGSIHVVYARVDVVWAKVSFYAIISQVMRDVEGVPSGVGLLVPGVTPWRSTLAPETGANNPGLRLVEYDQQTGEVK